MHHSHTCTLSSSNDCVHDDDDDHESREEQRNTDGGCLMMRDWRGFFGEFFHDVYSWWGRGGSQKRFIPNESSFFAF
jgi:hypothetical protein